MGHFLLKDGQLSCEVVLGQWLTYNTIQTGRLSIGHFFQLDYSIATTPPN